MYAKTFKCNKKEGRLKNKTKQKKKKQTNKQRRILRLHKCSYMIRENKTERERAIEEKMIEI